MTELGSAVSMQDIPKHSKAGRRNESNERTIIHHDFDARFWFLAKDVLEACS